MDGHASRFADDLLTRPGELVEVASLVAHGGVHRRNLVDLAGEALQLGTDLGCLERARVATRGDDALGVAGVAPLAEADDAVIRLGLSVKVVDEASGASDADGQQSRRGRVEGSGVADTALAENAPHLADGVERGDAGRLVEREDPSSARERRSEPRSGTGGGDAGHRVLSISRRATSSTLRRASGREQASSAPAARG